MHILRGLILSSFVLSLGFAIAGCDTLENFEIWDTKKKLTGYRKPVFPEGVPGVNQGVPPQLVKGYQEPPAEIVGPDPAARAAAAASQQAEPKKVEAPKPKPKPKPKPVAQPGPQQQPQQQPPQQAQAPWPGSQPQQQPAWPAPR